MYQEDLKFISSKYVRLLNLFSICSPFIPKIGGSVSWSFLIWAINRGGSQTKRAPPTPPVGQWKNFIIILRDVKCFYNKVLLPLDAVSCPDWLAFGPVTVVGWVFAHTIARTTTTFLVVLWRLLNNIISLLWRAERKSRFIVLCCFMSRLAQLLLYTLRKG